MNSPELSDEDISFILDNSNNIHHNTHNSWGSPSVRVNPFTRSINETDSTSDHTLFHSQCDRYDNSPQKMIGVIEAGLRNNNLDVQSLATDVLLPKNRPASLHDIPGPSWSAENGPRHNQNTNALSSKSNVNAPPLIFRTWQGEDFCLPSPEHMLVPSQNPPLVSHDNSRPLSSFFTQNQATNHSSTEAPSSEFSINNTEQTVVKNKVPSSEHMLVSSQNQPLVSHDNPLSLKSYFTQYQATNHSSTESPSSEFRMNNTDQTAVKNRVASSEHMLVPSQNHPLVSHDTLQRFRNDFTQNQAINHSAVRSHISSELNIENAEQRAMQHEVSSLEVHFSRTLLDTYIMFLHAHECDRPVCSTVDILLLGEVQSFCKAAKKVLNHVNNCTEESRCPLTDCKRLKQFQNHFKTCTDQRDGCSVCRILKLKFDLSRQMRVCVRNDCSFCWTLIQLNENSNESLAHPVPLPQQTSARSLSDGSSHVPLPDRRHSSSNSSTMVQSSHPVPLQQQTSARPLGDGSSHVPVPDRRHSIDTSSNSSTTTQSCDQNGTEAQLSLLVHSLKCRKLAGECNKPGCGKRKKDLLHLLTCKKGKICSDDNCQRDFFHSVLTKHRQTCSTGCSHCRFFKARLGNHPFHINDDPLLQHKPQNVDNTTDLLEENSSTSRLEHAARSSSCTDVTLAASPGAQTAQVPSISRREQPISGTSTFTPNITLATRHQAENAQVPSVISKTKDRFVLLRTDSPTNISRTVRPDISISLESTSSSTRSRREPLGAPNASSVNITPSTNLGETPATSSQEHSVAGSSNPSSTVQYDVLQFDEKVSLVLHAMKCRMSENNCVPYCAEAKHLVAHFVSCENERNCNRCERSRKMFRSIQARHWEICRERSNCSCCEFFKNRLGNLPSDTNTPENINNRPNVPSDATVLPSSSAISRSSSTDSESSADEEIRTSVLPSYLPVDGALEDGPSAEKRIKLEKSSQEQKKQDKPEESEDDLCKICMDAPMNTVFLECGHIVACVTCGEKSKNCPICRQKIKRIVRTFKA